LFKRIESTKEFSIFQRGWEPAVEEDAGRRSHPSGPAISNPAGAIDIPPDPVCFHGADFVQAGTYWLHGPAFHVL
jgi:hypothetical protein